jgi:hypothetical protein
MHFMKKATMNFANSYRGSLRSLCSTKEPPPEDRGCCGGEFLKKRKNYAVYGLRMGVKRRCGMATDDMNKR